MHGAKELLAQTGEGTSGAPLIHSEQGFPKAWSHSGTFPMEDTEKLVWEHGVSLQN